MKTNKAGAKAAKMDESVCIQQITLKLFQRKPNSIRPSLNELN